MRSKEDQPCLKETQGTCRGCNVMDIAILLMRWQALTLDEATQEIQQEYCPIRPDHAQNYINREASFGFGQRRHENVEFSAGRTPLRRKPSKGLPNSKMSKSSTGRFFVEKTVSA